jgi:hypothetical protein
MDYGSNWPNSRTRLHSRRKARPTNYILWLANVTGADTIRVASRKDMETSPPHGKGAKAAGHLLFANILSSAVERRFYLRCRGIYGMFGRVRRFFTGASQAIPVEELTILAKPAVTFSRVHQLGLAGVRSRLHNWDPPRS